MLAAGKGSQQLSYRPSLVLDDPAYIEALPVDQELADQVWEAWDTGPAQRPINSVESRADGQSDARTY